MYPRVQLHAGREKSLRFHHPWLFSRAIAKVPAGLPGGSLVHVVADNGEVVGTGYYNTHSQIAVRLFAFEKIKVDADFFEEKFRKALAFRRRFLDLTATNAFRLVFSESDGLPGLIVDVYGEYLVLQIHTLGMDVLRSVVVDALVKVLQPKGIYERSDLDVRKKEGLKTFPVGLLYGEEPPQAHTIQENGLTYVLDIPHGQKTGFFLDQRENRLALRQYACDKNVLNLFSYSGGFSVSALAGGAKKVTSVDISEPALELARTNFTLNNFQPADHEFIAGDVFAFLEKMAQNKQKYDLIIVDPPAFVKNQDSLHHGTNAYIKLNEQAMKLLSDDGILVSSSCSSHVSPELFRMILFKAALAAGRELILLEQKNQPADHPLNVNFPEGEYLKFVVCSARLL